MSITAFETEAGTPVFVEMVETARLTPDEAPANFWDGRSAICPARGTSGTR